MNSTIAFQTILRKEITRFLRIWTQTLLPSVITMALYFLIFGTIIGSKIEDMAGFTYIEFILPGLIMMAVLTNAYSNVSSSFFGMKFMRSIEEIMVSPTPAWVVVSGFTLGGVARGLCVGVLVTIVGLFFTTIPIHNIFFILLYVLLTALAFSLAGFTNGMFARKFDDVSIVPTFVLTPLTYLGGVFYSISLLPEPFRTISKFNPLVYMIDGFRYGFLGIHENSLLLGLAILVILCVTLFIVNVRLVKRGSGLRN